MSFHALPTKKTIEKILQLRFLILFEVQENSMLQLKKITSICVI